MIYLGAYLAVGVLVSVWYLFAELVEMDGGLLALACALLAIAPLWPFWLWLAISETIRKGPR